MHAHISTYEGNGSMDAGSDLGLATKGLAIDLEVAGSGLVSCRFFIPFSFFNQSINHTTMCPRGRLVEVHYNDHLRVQSGYGW